MVLLSHLYMTTGKTIALIIQTFVDKGSIEMYKIICLVYGHTNMKYNLRKNSVATRSDWYLCLVAQKLWVRRLRYSPGQHTSCGFIWPLLCPCKPQIGGLMPLVRITMMLKRYHCLGLLLPLRGVRRKCPQRRWMRWAPLRQVSGVSWSLAIFGLYPRNGEFELLSIYPS